MPDTCALWVNLASAGPRVHPHSEPTAYLHFPSTGLMVGLPDEPGMLVEPGEVPTRFALREADAIGLGLTPGDVALGVALCSGAEGESGWRCDPVELVVSDDAGELHLATAALWSDYDLPAFQPPAIEATASPMEIRRHALRPRVLVYATEHALASGALASVAARTTELDARVVLAAVGELPESRRHAEEETHALDRLLAMAAPLFGGRVAALRVELGGDPVHGLLTLAADERVDQILVPDDVTSREDEELVRALRRHTGRPVELVAAPRPSEGPAEQGAVEEAPRAESMRPGSERVARRLAITIGGSADGAPWARPEAWSSTVRAAVRERVRTAAPVPPEAQCSLTARWFVHPGREDAHDLAGRFPLDPIVEALVEAAYLSPAQLALVQMESEVVETDPDLAEQVVAVLRC